MKKLLSGIAFIALLVTPASIIAQDTHHYEDKAHHDSHDWNDKEDQAYKRYLQENHKKEHEFAKANKREQSDYWKWRHEHPDGDHK
jgi:hypothetical protein